MEGEVTYPLGPDAFGYIMYSADGHVSVNISTANRPSFRSGDLLSGSVQEQAAAAQTYVSYCGTYEVSQGKVVHRVEASLFPNWAGSEQERYYAFEGDRLTLSTGPMLLGGRQRRAFLTWERVSSHQMEPAL
ncbi:MAG: lipocalin-like domain-containing protein [Chloroflexota bacterium]|nr:lipocalin-like domain-containing protein [Chloroflexota bacterium]